MSAPEVPSWASAERRHRTTVDRLGAAAPNGIYPQGLLRQAGRSLTDGSGEAPIEQIPDPLAEELDPAFASARWSLVDWEQGPADSAPGPEAANSVAQRAARLWSALEALPPEQREAFLLHEEGEMGLAEIAAVTGANAETVKSRLRYAVRKLRGALGDLAPASSREALS